MKRATIYGIIAITALLYCTKGPTNLSFRNPQDVERISSLEAPQKWGVLKEFILEKKYFLQIPNGQIQFLKNGYYLSASGGGGGLIKPDKHPWNIQGASITLGDRKYQDFLIVSQLVRGEWQFHVTFCHAECPPANDPKFDRYALPEYETLSSCLESQRDLCALDINQ